MPGPHEKETREKQKNLRRVSAQGILDRKDRAANSSKVRG